MTTPTWQPNILQVPCPLCGKLKPINEWCVCPVGTLLRAIDHLTEDQCRLVQAIITDGFASGGDDEEEDNWLKATDVVGALEDLVHNHMTANGWPI